MFVCKEIELELNWYLFFTLLAGRGMAATNCGSILSKCSCTVNAHQVLHVVVDWSKCQAKNLA